MTCVGEDCPEDGEANAVCGDYWCREGMSPHKPSASVYVCSTHLSAVIGSLLARGSAALRCRRCQRGLYGSDRT